MIKWYVMVKHGGAVGGPYKSEFIANEHYITLKEKYKGQQLVVEERDIHKLRPHRRVMNYVVS